MSKAWHCHMPEARHVQLRLLVSHPITFQVQTPQCEMADWSTLYSAALDVRDRRESTHRSCIDACMLPTPTALLLHRPDH